MTGDRNVDEYRRLSPRRFAFQRSVQRSNVAPTMMETLVPMRTGPPTPKPDLNVPTVPFHSKCLLPTDITTGRLPIKLPSSGTVPKGLNPSPSGERVRVERRYQSEFSAIKFETWRHDIAASFLREQPDIVSYGPARDEKSVVPPVRKPRRFGRRSQICLDSTGRRLIILDDRGQLGLHEFESLPRGKEGDFKRCEDTGCRLWADLTELELALLAGRPSLSRPRPTPIDAVISSEDALLLQYAYCGNAGVVMSTLFQLLSIDYGLAVRSPVLRSAMLCWCASRLGPSFEKRKSFLYTVGLRLLARRVNDPTTLDEADVFATFILAQIFPFSSLRVLLTNGYRRILRHVSAHRTSSEILSIFGPFALDVEEFATQLGSRHSVKPLGRRTSHRVKWSKVASRLRYGRFANLTTLYTRTALEFIFWCDRIRSNIGGSSNEYKGSAVREYMASLRPGFVGLAISWAIQMISLDSRETENGTNVVQLLQAMIRLTVAEAHKLSRQTAYFPSRYISILEAVCRENETPQSTTIPVGNFAEIAIGHFQIPSIPRNEINETNSKFWAMLVFGSRNPIVTAAHEEMQFHATLVFQRSKEFCFSAESIAFISLNSDHGPLEFVRMDYVSRIVESYWGPFGLAILDLTTTFLSLSKGEEIAREYFLQTGTVFLELRWLPTGISFIAQATLVEWETLLGCLRWLLSTLSSDKPVALRARGFAPVSAFSTDTNVIKCAYSVQEKVIAQPQDTGNTCWISLIDGANIGLHGGYFPADRGSSSRDWVGKGLRIPFSVLVQVAGIQEVVEIEGTPVLCGFRTALIPITLFDDGSVQWHFVAAREGPGDRFRWLPDQDEFLQAIPPDRLRHVPVTKLTGTAYVGGWASIRTVLGNTDPPNPIPRSNLPQTSRQYVCSGVDLQAALQITPGVPVSPFLGITRKLEFVGMRCRYTPEEDMCGMVDQLYSKQVILYDDLQKTAYLCRLISLVVSLVRAYLRDNEYEYDRKILEFETGVEKSQAEVRKLLPKHIDAAVNFKFEDAFKIVTKRYSAMNATLRPELRCTKSAILGFEIADILDSNDLYARKLPVTNGVETWNALAELIDVVFCGGYGDVILSSDGSRCPQLPPSGCNVLVCPLNLLKKHFDSVDGNCNKQRGREKFVWESTGTEFECGITKLGRKCNGWECLGHRLQRINAPRKLIKNHLKNPRKEQSVSFDGDGAIGFGSGMNLRRARSKAADDSFINAAGLIGKVVSPEDLHDDVSCRIRITVASEACSASTTTASS